MKKNNVGLKDFNESIDYYLKKEPKIFERILDSIAVNQGIVFEKYKKDKLAGILSEDENGFHFMYDKDYLNSDNPQPISLTLPLSNKIYDNNILHPFFDGLIPEGWLLDIAEKNWKINSRAKISI